MSISLQKLYNPLNPKHRRIKRMASTLYLLFVGWVASRWFPILEKWLTGELLTSQELSFFIGLPIITIAVLWYFTKLEKKDRITETKKAIREVLEESKKEQ